MKERPILFSGPMVRAILDGRDPKGSNAARKVSIPVEAIRAAYEAGHTVKEIASSCGCSVQPVKRIMKEAGIARRPAKQRPGAMVGEGNPAWKGGRCLRSDGYVEIWTPSGRMLEHRAVMERALGRALLATEVVHHRDGDKQHNDIANLEVMSQSAHAALHAPEMHAARYGHG